MIMSVEENKALIRRVYDLGNRRQFDEYADCMAQGCVFHFPDRDWTRQQEIDFGPVWFGAFPDIFSTVEDVIGEGDKVAFRVTHRATHKGKFMGIPPTGNKIEMTNAAIYRIVGGKVVEGWVTSDDLRFRQQLGTIPKR
jgi:predicted ester cyclase